MTMRIGILTLVVLLMLPMTGFAQESTNPKQDATDVMMYSALIEFANTITFGITSDAIRENSISYSEDHMLYMNVPITSLNQAEQKGVSAGRLLGRITGILTWAIIIGFFIWLRRRKRIKVK